MNNKIIALVALVVVVVIGGLAFYRSGEKGGREKETSQIVTEETFRMAEVATHDSKSSCWTAIRGAVYDLTDWVGKHPGGEEAIASLCGKDGTQSFVAQHEGQENPESVLAGYRIGALE
jgi:cytochrome b involved in lipid metabolism